MSLPRMSLHIGDYKKDTGHLRAAGHGAYLLLIMHYWATGGLPDDDRQLAAIACMSDAEWKKHRAVIEPLFKSGWRHKRVDEELEEAEKKYRKRVEAGKRSGIARNKKEQCSSNVQAKPEQPITLTDKELVREERARPSEAEAIAIEAEVLCGITDRATLPAGMCGFTARIEAGMRAGWTRDDVLNGVRKGLATLGGQAPDSFKYFEKPIARAFAERTAPIPIEQPRRGNGHANNRDLGAVARAAAERAAELAAGDSLCDADGRPPLRLISQREGS